MKSLNKLINAFFHPFPALKVQIENRKLRQKTKTTARKTKRIINKTAS